MRLIARPFAFTVSVSALAVALTACAASTGSAGLAVNQPAEFAGKIVGPLEFGQAAAVERQPWQQDNSRSVPCWTRSAQRPPPRTPTEAPQMAAAS
ncbi:hypothetical protein [Hydrogenophaga luteola]|uniref:Uncharacterized protein n=1 Tax=Hydrogenophaga luteola TaxID=1591122 RepID=A0ABV7W9K2_9BURK